MEESDCEGLDNELKLLDDFEEELDDIQEELIAFFNFWR